MDEQSHELDRVAVLQDIAQIPNTHGMMGTDVDIPELEVSARVYGPAMDVIWANVPNPKQPVPYRETGQTTYVFDSSQVEALRKRVTDENPQAQFYVEEAGFDCDTNLMPARVVVGLRGTPGLIRDAVHFYASGTVVYEPSKLSNESYRALLQAGLETLFTPKNT